MASVPRLPPTTGARFNSTSRYYLSKEKLLEQNGSRAMSDEHLERFIVEYIGAQEAQDIAFTWHGGEPTLLGLRFFRRVVELQKQHTPAGRSVLNDLQTNGTLLDDEWCAFLAENAFLVGVSPDGPEELHDAYRPTKKGGPSFRSVVAAAGMLQRHGVTFGTLTTINRRNSLQPLSVYRFLRDETSSRYMLEFGLEKHRALPTECRKCSFLELC